MGERALKEIETRIERVLHELGRRGDLELDDQILNHLLVTARPVPLSPDFEQRARAAMATAQQQREEQDPAVAIGAVVSRARLNARMGLAEVAGQLNIAPRFLEELEIGRLSALQIMRLFPPAMAHRLLDAIELAVDDFTSLLMCLAAAGGGSRPMAATRTADRRQQKDESALLSKVSDYIAALKHLDQTDDSEG
jgi:hypothetical protein